MRSIFKLVWKISVILIISLSACGQDSSPNATNCISTANEYCVLLPHLATIELLDNSSLTGKLSEIDGQSKEIVITFSDKPQNISIEKIRKVTFKGDENLPEDKKMSALRGNEVWAIASLGDFRLDSSENKVLIKSNSINKRQGKQGFERTPYFFKEIVFSTNAQSKYEAIVSVSF